MSGIIELARKEVEDIPLVLLFLAKLSVCVTETIPWQVLVCNEHSDYSLRRVIWIEEDCRWLFRELTKISDWLFSPQGYNVLVWCRNKLEELGLISWKKETNCVHIHGLTLKGVRKMLLENHLFLPKLLSFLSWRDTLPLSYTAERISISLFGFLMCNVLSSSAGFLSTASFGQWSDEHERVFNFLSGVLDRNCFQHVAKSSETTESGELIMSTFRSMVSNVLLQVCCSSKGRAFGWIKVYLNFPLNEQVNRIYRNLKSLFDPFMNPNHSITEVCSIIGSPSYINCAINFSTDYQEFVGTSNDEISMYCFTFVAERIDKTYGHSARRVYLQQASQRCPQLLTEPNMLGIKKHYFKVYKLLRLNFWERNTFSYPEKLC